MPCDPGPYLAYTINDTPYKCVDGEWVVDVDEASRINAEESHKRDLMRALSTRVLSDAELAEVGRYGRDLNIEPGVPFSEDAKARELTNALLIQSMFRCGNVKP